MERCYFNSCIFNDSYFLDKFKILSKEQKSFFAKVDANEELIISLDIKSDLKKYIFCTQHYNNLLELKKIKDSILKNPTSISKENLISLNKILKNNVDIKKILDNLSFQNETKIIPILINNLNTAIQKDNKLYLLIVLNHLLKEYFICKKYISNDIYTILVKEIISLNLSINSSTNTNDENLFRDVLIFSLCLNNIECLFNNAQHKQLDLQVTVNLMQNVVNLFGQVVVAHKDIENKKISNEIFYNVIGFFNVYLLSKVKNIELVIFVINFIVKTSKQIFDFLNTYQGEKFFKSTNKNFVICLNTILINILNIKLTEFNKDEIDVFVKDIDTFNQKQKNEVLFYQNSDKIAELKDKINKLK